MCPPYPCVTATANEIEIALAIKAGANVVQVYGFCFDAPDGKVRLVMELCSHGSLRSHLQALPAAKVSRGNSSQCIQPWAKSEGGSGSSRAAAS